MARGGLREALETIVSERSVWTLELRDFYLLIETFFRGLPLKGGLGGPGARDFGAGGPHWWCGGFYFRAKIALGSLLGRSWRSLGVIFVPLGPLGVLLWLLGALFGSLGGLLGGSGKHSGVTLRVMFDL